MQYCTVRAIDFAPILQYQVTSIGKSTVTPTIVHAPRRTVGTSMGKAALFVSNYSNIQCFILLATLLTL